MVTATSSGWSDGAQSRKIVCSGGSSMNLRSALAAFSVSRSRRVTMSTW
jgi:hypothetical protein